VNRRWKGRIAVVVGLAAALLLLLRWGSPAINRLLFPSDYVPFYSVTVGMTDQEVRSLLGPPDHEYRHDDAPEDYYVEGYSFKRRPIRGSVLIYVGGKGIAYVYLDDGGRVEDVFVGGS
jgi:hypothetical protein